MAYNAVVRQPGSGVMTPAPAGYRPGYRQGTANCVRKSRAATGTATARCEGHKVNDNGNASDQPNDSQPDDCQPSACQPDGCPRF